MIMTLTWCLITQGWLPSMSLTISNLSFFCEEVMNIDSIFLGDYWIQAFHLNMELSNTENKGNVTQKSCFPCENNCMWQPWGVKGEYLYFYIWGIEDFEVGIPFTIMQSDPEGH